MPCEKFLKNITGSNPLAFIKMESNGVDARKVDGSQEENGRYRYGSLGIQGVMTEYCVLRIA